MNGKRVKRSKVKGLTNLDERSESSLLPSIFFLTQDTTITSPMTMKTVKETLRLTPPLPTS